MAFIMYSCMMIPTSNKTMKIGTVQNVYLRKLQ